MICRTVRLAAALLLAATSVHAQIHSPQVTIRKKTRPENIEWLWQYSPTDKHPEGDENSLVLDPRFEPLLRRNFTAPQAFWGRQQPDQPRSTLAETAAAFLAVPDRVVADQNRYLTITGCQAHFCPNRGLLWADLNPTRNQQPLLIFAALDWVSDSHTPDEAAATYTLWLFPNQPLDPTSSGPSRIPPAFRTSLDRWATNPLPGTGSIPHITTTVLVDPDGSPHQLPQEAQAKP